MKKIHTYGRVIVFLVIVQCLAIGYASDEAGCSHNGTMFADGSLVPSLEPCLSCKCVDAHLKCSLRVCPEQPIPPPRGCVLVQRKLSCCPHVSCKKYHNENQNRRITYNSNWYSNEADDVNGDADTQQKVISKNSLYRRIEDEEIYGNDQMCVHNGTIYRTGSAMSTSSLCSYCYCIGGRQKCVRPKCLLTSPGCVPVYIDSSCCPIRYDCGALGTDLRNSFNTKDRYFRIENKHYNRMRSRAQRNRGCLVASNYYPEGEKLPNDLDKPCEICFCIRGERKCTPKKCAPYIGNCKPRILKGQCCPANYECDHSDEESIDFSHRPRQFDLFSYFFDDETTSKEPDHHPYSPTQDNNSPIASTSEKSFFDAIREGLNYIDSNDEHVEKILDASSINSTSLPGPPLQKNTTELSFLDILLSDDEEEDQKEESLEEPVWQNEANLSYRDSVNFGGGLALDVSDASDRYALLDEKSTVPTLTVTSIKHLESSPSVQTSNYDRSATEKIIREYITFTPVPNYNFDVSTLLTNEEFETSTSTEATTQDQMTLTPPSYYTTTVFEGGSGTDWSTSNPPKGDDHFTETTSSAAEVLTRLETTTSVDLCDKNSTDLTTTTEPSLVSTFFKEFSHLFGDKNSLKEKDAISSSSPSSRNQTFTLNTLVSTVSPAIPTTTRRVIPTIVSSPGYPLSTSSTPITVTITSPTTRASPSSTTAAPTTPSTTKRTTTQTTTQKSTPTTTSKIPTTTQQQTPKPESQSTTTSKPITTSPTLSQRVNLTFTPTDPYPPTTKNPVTTTNQPSLIDSNPSILDSDLNYDYGDQPTLPPSLPNLKIIPFLPADAVRKDNVNVLSKLEFYSTNYPVLTENYENPYLGGDNLQNQNSDFTAFEVDESEGEDAFSHHKDNSEFNHYNIDANYGQYPSITETPSVEQAIRNKYPAYSKYNVDYDFETYHSDKHIDASKYAPGSYDVLDGHDYTVQSRNPSFDKFVTEYPERRVYSKIEFSTANPIFGYNGNNKFSPPSKTEGGFLPKEPIDDDQYYEKFHTTKYLPDITTEPPPKTNITTLLIGITSEDPFKNVIRTEPPPNLLTLIEDKDMRFHPEPDTNIDRDYPSIHLSDIEKEIISITTDVNYDSSQEYVQAPLVDNVEYSLEYSHNKTINKEDTTFSETLPSTSTKYSTEKSVSSNIQHNPTVDTVPKDFLGLLGYIFKDNKDNADTKPTESTLQHEKQTIPPFKKISSTSLSLLDILNFTKPVENSSKKVDLPQRKNNKIYEYPTTVTIPSLVETSTPRVENFNILRDVLLATLNSPTGIDTLGHRDNHPTIDVPKPIYSSHSIHQFLNPIFAGNAELTQVTSKYSPIGSDIDLSIPKLNSQIDDNKDELNNNVFGPESYQVLNDYPSTSNSRPFGENPVDYDALKERHSDDNSPNIFSKSTNSFQNSMGILKLAGCNIYGRMYRVGRIITELSNPCLECKCTEVGVHCTTLSC